MRATVTGCFIVMFMLLAAPAPAANARAVVVEVTAIAAGTAPAGAAESSVELDLRLQPFSKNLSSLFAYDRYTFLSKDRMTIAFGESVLFRLPEHFHLEVGPQRTEQGGADMIEMMVTLYREEPQRARGRPRGAPEREIVLRTRIRLKNGGTVLLGGPPIRAGVLVLALTARG